jgi:hypothetical protein
MGYAEEMKVLTNKAKEKGKLDALNEYNTVLDYIKQKVREYFALNIKKKI